MEIKWNREDRYLHFPAGETCRKDSVSLEYISGTGLDSIRELLRSMDEGDQWIEIGSESPDSGRLNSIEVEKVLDEVSTDVLIVNFSLLEDGTLAAMMYVLNPLVETQEEIFDLAHPYVDANGATLIESHCRHVSRWSGTEWTVRWAVGREFTVVDDVIEMAANLSSMLRFGYADPRRPEGAYSLVLSGRPEILLGQPESDWLDVKRENYGLSDKRQKYEMACDIAAFANAEKGGVIVIGIESEKDANGVDVLARVRPVKAGSVNIQQVSQILHSLIVPPIEGLKIRSAPLNGGDLVVVRVPPQREGVKPFLVRGALVGEKVTGSFFSIPQRRDEDKSSMSPEAVHSMLAAARAVMNLNAHTSAGQTVVNNRDRSFG